MKNIFFLYFKFFYLFIIQANINYCDKIRKTRPPYFLSINNIICKLKNIVNAHFL